MKNFIHLFCLLFLSPFILVAQQGAIKGTLVDAATKAPLGGANIRLTSVADTTHRMFATSKRDGSFEFPNVKHQSYSIRITYVGYQTLMKVVLVDSAKKNLGVLEMHQSAVGYKEVIVEGQQPAVTQIGDTTEFNARAFKVNPDATAADLVSKVPTITVEGATVRAQGEEVRQVLVDGRPFFGGDPTLALRNLPADAIEKIQVFDKLSDQAEFSGFDDGQSIKTLNLITRLDRRFGEFGKAHAGYGDQERYTTGGNLNSFQGDRRISALGLSNNVNQQNFSLQDLL